MPRRSTLRVCVTAVTVFGHTIKGFLLSRIKEGHQPILREASTNDYAALKTSSSQKTKLEGGGGDKKKTIKDSGYARKVAYFHSEYTFIKRRKHTT